MYLARNVKDNTNGFYKYIGDNRKTRKNVGPLLNEAEDLFTQNMVKAEVLNDFFLSVFISKTSLQEPKVSETRRKVWSKEDISLMGEDQIRE